MLLFDCQTVGLRELNVLHLEKDTAVAGETSMHYVRGAFAEGASVSVRAVDAGGGYLDWVMMDPDPAPRLVVENLVQQCRWRSIQFYLDVPDNAPLGLYDLKVVPGT